MTDWILSPKWREFQESIAWTSGLTIGVIGRKGELETLYNRLPPFSGFEDDPALAAVYKEFFRNVPRLLHGSKGKIFIHDPLKLPSAFIPLGNGSFLFLNGGFHESYQDLRSAPDAQDSDGLFTENGRRDRISAVKMNDLKNKTKRIEAVYERIGRSAIETTEFGQQMVLLSAIEEINKLMVSLFSPDRFDLQRVQDLAVNSLVILLDAEGACVFTNYGNGQITTASKGLHKELLDGLKKEWADTVSRSGESAGVVRWLSGGRNIDSRFRIEAEFMRNKGSTIFLGVINSGNKYVRMVIEALARQVTIAVEVAVLYAIIRQQMGTVINSVRHGIVLINSEGEVIMFNRAASDTLTVLGISLDFGCSIFGLGLNRGMETAIRKAVSTGDAFLQKKGDFRNGKGMLHLKWDVTPLLDDNGAITGAILIFEDVTEAVTLRRRMEDCERLITAGEVAAGLAHEIRNPLAAAAGAIQLCEMISDPAKQQEVLRKLRGELDRMSKVLTDFLRFAKPGGKVDIQPINLVALVNDLEFLIRSEALQYEVALIFSEAPEVFPIVRGDENNLKQVFINIAKNAIEAMPEGGLLKISWLRNDNRAGVQFEDNGPGIPRENLPMIFRPFYTTKLGGTGLGLSISSALIKDMGGEMNLKSVPGKGTTIQVMLPTCTELIGDDYKH
ncbi:MAG: ATP-binding protein [Bacillota bacterium]